MMLENKNILIGVSSSIAIYKTLELIRLFIKARANVRVIMTPASKKFITPLTFETLSQNKVLIEERESWADDNNHIAIGKWSDLFIIAPATANTINKLSNGIADNLLLQTALAYPRIKLLAPAANTNMIQNPLTKASLKMLKLCNFRIISPQVKELACKDIGEGAMAEPEEIYNNAVRELLKDEYWSDRKVVLNGGGTIEKIDDIRYISNFSSGKMASSLASALYYKGADVCFVSSTNSIKPNISQIHNIRVESAEEMLLFCSDSIRVAKKGKLSEATLMNDSRQELIEKKPYFFGVAAVSDYTPSFPQSGKMKKDDIGDKWSLELKQNIDILDSLDKNGIYTIGFKAETDTTNAQTNAQNMLEKKSLDAVCLNLISDQNGFGSNNNEIELITKNSNTTLPQDEKLNISLKLLDLLKEEFNE